MKICPKCNTEHNLNGLYCSSKCSHSRVFSEATKEKKRLSSIKYYESLTEEEKISINTAKREKYDYNEQQRKAKQTKVSKSLNTPYSLLSRESIRKKLLHECNNTCEVCGIKDVWNGKPISLEMDHIDGNNKNNARSNLRILCPNCHSQTHTFRARNIKSTKEIDIFKLTELLIKYKFATPALKALGFNNSPHKMRVANNILEALRKENKI